MSYDQFNSWWMMYSRRSDVLEIVAGGLSLTNIWCMWGLQSLAVRLHVEELLGVSLEVSSPASRKRSPPCLYRTKGMRNCSENQRGGNMNLVINLWVAYNCHMTPGDITPTSCLVSDPVFLLEIWSTSRLSCHRIISMQKEVPNTNIGNVLNISGWFFHQSTPGVNICGIGLLVRSGLHESWRF